jgi:hypothetical protein
MNGLNGELLPLNVEVFPLARAVWGFPGDGGLPHGSTCNQTTSLGILRLRIFDAYLMIELNYTRVFCLMYFNRRCSNRPL